jgi:hypothetical protein
MTSVRALFVNPDNELWRISGGILIFGGIQEKLR